MYTHESWESVESQHQVTHRWWKTTVQHWHKSSNCRPTLPWCLLHSSPFMSCTLYEFDMPFLHTLKDNKSHFWSAGTVVPSGPRSDPPQRNPSELTLRGERQTETPACLKLNLAQLLHIHRALFGKSKPPKIPFNKTAPVFDVRACLMCVRGMVMSLSQGIWMHQQHPWLGYLLSVGYKPVSFRYTLTRAVTGFCFRQHMRQKESDILYSKQREGNRG